MSKRNTLQAVFSTRQHMISQDFELYYYSDLHLKPVSLHSHDYYEFYFFLEGDVSILINGRSHLVSPGDFLLIPPDTPHSPSVINPDKPYRRFVLWISRDYCARLMDTSTAYGYLMQYVATSKNYLFSSDTVTFNTIHTRLFSILEEIRGNRFGKDAKVRLEIDSLLLYLNRLVHDQNASVSPRSDSLYESICDYISEHLADELSLSVLAGEFFVSKFYIAHLFKDTIGLPVHQYILKKRLAACKNAILGSVPVSRLLVQYGFHDYSSFYRAFKKEYGMSPTEYRQSHFTAEDLPESTQDIQTAPESDP